MHIFVAMPYGTKEGIDFNKVYTDLIKPALEKEEGFEVFRADEELRAGNIRPDMFQELLLADLVVVDLSIDNPNVWYELGVRHALRARGVVQIKSKRDHMPFDVSTDRTLTYHLKNGLLDPDYIDQDRTALLTIAKETLASWHGRKISPVYHLLPYLNEPDWKLLRVENAREFWEKQAIWERNVEIARKNRKPGDILVLADEAPIRFLRLEAYKAAAKALLKMCEFQLALEPVEKALSIDPEDLESRHQKGIILGRLKKFDASKEWLRSIIVAEENEGKYTKRDLAETWARIGRTEKDSWIDAWKKGNNQILEERIEYAVANDALLNDAMQTYLEGFYLDPSHYYSGINALTLLYLIKYLGEIEQQRKGGEEFKDAYAELRRYVEGGVRWAVKSELRKETMKQKNYWARVTAGDIEVLSGSIPDVVEKSYRYAIAAAEKDWFALDSSRQQLLILRDLGFQPQQVNAAIRIFDLALESAPKQWEPRLVFLFSGHMIDAPGRKEPRFPPNKEDIAAHAIAAKLDELGAGKDDLAICGGACGGDLLFAEACLQRGSQLEVRIPFKEPTFLPNSVTFAGEKWGDRFYRVKKHENTKLIIMTEELGEAPKGVNPYGRNNLWHLYSALAMGSDKVHFISLWNTKEGDGPGGTKHMIDEVSKYFGQVHILDTNQLFGNLQGGG
jgi:tetratricopeptide (TPR) repeat protein